MSGILLGDNVPAVEPSTLSGTLTLPAPSTEQPLATRRRSGPGPTPPARILIVDDERTNRDLLEVILKQDGLHILTAPNGQDALAIVADEPPDLILLDVMMPGMDGYELTRKLKSDLATRNIPIIMITAMNDPGSRLRGLTAGAEDFLSKPVDRAELSMRVRNLLRLKAYSDYHDKYSQILEGEVGSRTIDVRVERDRAQRYLDTAQVILLALDLEGRITLVNRFTCSMLGRPADQLLGLDWIDTCLPEQIRDHTRRQLSNLIRGELPMETSTVLTSTGEERTIDWRNTLVRDDKGNVTGTFSSGTDVTEQNRALQAVQVAEERVRFALEAAGVGIWDMDFTTGRLRWSEILESQYGLAAGTFGGTFDAFIARVHPEDRNALIETMQQANQSGADFTMLHRTLWADGTVRWLTGAGRVQLDAQGKPARGVGISQDITERYTLEKQFQQAQKMEAVGLLASGVAHDFNNLLTVILGCAELMTSGIDPASGSAEDLGEIKNAARRAAGLTKQLLAFGRQQVLHAQPVDLNKLITEITVMLRRLIGEQIDVVLTLAPQLPDVFADRGQLEQVLMNLVVNARDAMPDGGRVTIHTTDVDLENSSFHNVAVAPGKYIMLAVSDTGTGMTLETQRRLFEPFFTTKEFGKGTGLGLSTTYGIVKQSKGYIWVYSELGLGTTFKVYLPRADNQGATQATATAVAAPVARGLETLLLVEDEVGVRRLSRRILEGAGFRVLEAANAVDAEAIFAKHGEEIDLLVTDVIMPGCGGPELLRRLQQKTPRLKGLYMSGYTEPSPSARMELDRGLPFLQKPFTAAEFTRHVRQALDAG